MGAKADGSDSCARQVEQAEHWPELQARAATRAIFMRVCVPCLSVVLECRAWMPGVGVRRAGRVLRVVLCVVVRAVRVVRSSSPCGQF